MNKAVWRELARRMIGSCIKAWIGLLILGVICHYGFGDEIPGTGFLTTFLGATLFGYGFFAAQRWVPFWRRTSASIFEFWFGAAALALLGLVLNGSLAVVFHFMIPTKFATWAFYAPWELAWIALIVFTVQLRMVEDHLNVLQRSVQMRWRLAALLAIYVALFSVVALFLISRALSYGLTEVLFLSSFFFGNTMVTRSIARRPRLLATLGSSGVVIAAAACSFWFLELRRTLVDVCAPEKMEAITKPSVLLNCSDRYKGPALIAALTKLDVLCPPRPSDQSTVFVCADPNGRETISLRFSVDPSSLVELSNSSSEYVRTVAVMNARRLKTRSPELSRRLEELAKIPGRVGVLAAVTLSDPQASPWFRFELDSPSRVNPGQ